ncbi:MAG: hypothetical protein NTV43_00130 [Methylococcales bacterium]|nr:hypothetical protein [Methylococcales bacterium]
MAELKEDKKKQWLSLGKAAYLSAYQRMVHFSAKAVNSNASAAGVRIIDRADLPYISVSSVGPALVPLDYFNGANTATASNQINSFVLNNLRDRFKEIDEDEVSFIKQMTTRYDFADLAGEIDCHLKQIIMPDEAGNDLCLTPLHSSGLSKLINDTERRIAQENDDKKFSLFRHAGMNYGGSNTQNIGGLANELKKPLFFGAPEEDMDIRKSLAIHYKGFSYMPTTQVDDYLDWLDEACSPDKAKTMPQKLEEERLLKRIVRSSFLEADRQFAYLTKNKANFPGEQLLSSDLDRVFHGLIFEEERNNDWFIDFGNAVADYIKNKKRKKTIAGKRVDIDAIISNQDAITLQGLISDIARTLSQTTARSTI